MKKQLLFIACLLSVLLLQAQVIHVPGDYGTIQQGIDAAVNGDVVLVDKGEYFESIDFKGKAITVKSHYDPLDPDSSFIYETVIDGSKAVNPDSASVVYFISGEDTTSVLSGFTIRYGSGTMDPVTGWRSGGGIYCNYSGAKIVHNIIESNIIDHFITAAGGGISAVDSESTYRTIVIKYNTIRNNAVYNDSNYPQFAVGGGITIQFMIVRIENNVISGNLADGRSYGAGIGMGLCKGSISDNIITGNFANANYGSCWGAGIYGESLEENFLISGNEISENVIEIGTGDHTIAGGIGLIDVSGYDRNIYIDKNIISNNSAKYGGGIAIKNLTKCHITNNIIDSNYVTATGGGIVVSNTSWKDSGKDGGMVSLNDMSSSGKSKDQVLEFANNTIINNQAVTGGGGIGLRLSNESLLFYNNIIYNNSAIVGGDFSNVYSATPYMYNNNIDTNLIHGPWEGEYNINVDPMFEDDSCHLSEESLCIEAGIDSKILFGITYYAPLYDMDGESRAQNNYFDIGADERWIINPGFSDISSSETEQYLHVYPNPCYDNTNVVFNLEHTSYAELTLFNLSGKKINTVAIGLFAAGQHTYNLDLSILNIGMYLCVLLTENGSVVAKLIKQ